MTTRREALSHSAKVLGLLAAAGLLPTHAFARVSDRAFYTQSFAYTVSALGGLTSATPSADIVLTAQEIAENGASVPLEVSTTLPGVNRLALLVEKNPNILAAVFNVTDAVDARAKTNVKMAQTSNVFGVAVMSDGRVLFAQKEVKVTLGGCGG